MGTTSLTTVTALPPVEPPTGFAALGVPARIDRLVDLLRREQGLRGIGPGPLPDIGRSIGLVEEGRQQVVGSRIEGSPHDSGCQ